MLVKPILLSGSQDWLLLHTPEISETWRELKILGSFSNDDGDGEDVAG